jgi:hypothetical protein
LRLLDGKGGSMQGMDMCAQWQTHIHTRAKLLLFYYALGWRPRLHTQRTDYGPDNNKLKQQWHRNLIKLLVFLVAYAHEINHNIPSQPFAERNY